MAAKSPRIRYEGKMFYIKGCYRNDKYFSACFFNAGDDIKNIANIIALSLDVALETLESKYLVGSIELWKEKGVFNIEYKLIPTRREFNKYLNEKAMNIVLNNNKDLFSKLEGTSFGFFTNKKRKVLWSFGSLEKEDIEGFLEKFISSLIYTYSENSQISVLEKKLEHKKDSYDIFLKLIKKEIPNYFT